MAGALILAGVVLTGTVSIGLLFRNRMQQNKSTAHTVMADALANAIGQVTYNLSVCSATFSGQQVTTSAAPTLKNIFVNGDGGNGNPSGTLVAGVQFGAIQNDPISITSTAFQNVNNLFDQNGILIGKTALLNVVYTQSMTVGGNQHL